MPLTSGPMIGLHPLSRWIYPRDFLVQLFLVSRTAWVLQCSWGYPGFVTFYGKWTRRGSNLMRDHRWGPRDWNPPPHQTANMSERKGEQCAGLHG
jgi:hypothetical protein